MQQLVPGIFHWTAINPAIDARVSSYLIPDAEAVIDPITPEEGLDALPARPRRILLTSGHHLRDARRFAEHFGASIHASRAAVAHLGSDGAGIEAWPEGPGEIAPGITALPIGVLAADEGALHLSHGPGALALADAVQHSGPELGFFPDGLLGDDPESVKEGLEAALGALVESLSFDALLFAHGEPLASGGREALLAFATRGDRPA